MPRKPSVSYWPTRKGGGYFCILKGNRHELALGPDDAPQGPTYLAAGRPVVTCKVGDLCDFLVDSVNAYVVEPGDEREFADRMIAVLRDPVRATRIGAAGQHCCLTQLDYHAHCDDLAKFFVNCIENSPHAARSRILKQAKSRTVAL